MAVGAGRIKRKKQPEGVFQASLVKSLAMLLDPGCVLFAVPNGGGRSPIEAKILVGQGVLPGIPDLIVLFNGKAAGMELKAPKRGVTDKQAQMHQRFARAGIPVAMIRTLDEALNFLTSAGVPFRIKRGSPNG